MIPDWAPNIHPLIVHFPIALLFVAVFLDAVKLFLVKIWLEKATVLLYILGTLGVVASYWSGSVAAETVSIPVQAQVVMTDHENMALITMLYYLAFVAIRVVGSWFRINIKSAIQSVFILLGAFGCYLVWQTGDLGGRLVFEHGVGVAVVERHVRPDADADTESTEPSHPIVSDDGSWQWVIESHATYSLTKYFNWYLASEEIATDINGAVEFSLEGEEALFTFGENLRSLSVEAEVNLDEFSGVFRIVYHVQGNDHYGFMEISNGRMILGHNISGDINYFEEGEFTPGGWMRLRTSADGRHFYGFSQDQVIVHGHADELEQGTTGLYFKGDGIIRLRHIDVQNLR